MTDFLTRLAQRVLGLAPTVQPLVASLFEPTQAVATNTFSFDIEQEYAAENQGGQRPSFSGMEAGSAPPSSYGRDGSRSPASQEQRLAAMQAEQARTNLYARYSQAASLRVTAGSQEASATQSASSPGLFEGGVHGSIRRTSAMGTQSEYYAMRSPTAQEQDGNASTDRLSLHAGQQNIAARGNHSNSIQSNGETQFSAPQLTVFASTETPSSMLTTPMQPRVLHPLVTARDKTPVGAQFIAPSRLDAPPLTHLMHQSDVVPQSPTIQVTIGRIEVRATPPPPTARPQQQHPTSSRMSLDEYLKQRSRGGK